MDKHDLFKDSLKKAAAEFRELARGSFVRIVSHLDADGISAVSVMIRALDRLNMRYSVSIVQQLNPDFLAELAEEKHDVYVFTDLGSGYLAEIMKFLRGRKVFVLDHHDIDPSFDTEKDEEGLVFANPHLFGIDGGIEISGSGVVYLFARELDEANRDMAGIAVVGAVGDVQENRGFMKLNRMILDDAVEQGIIEVREGLRGYGFQTRPVHKVLEYSSDPHIPGVTGSESKAIEFLHQLGISPKKGNEWKKMSDLTPEEMKRLIAGVIVKRVEEGNPDDVIGYNYILANEKKGCPLRDAKEFATLLNACGRLDNASLGIGACLGDEELKRKALQSQQEYRKEIVKGMNWFRDNNKNGLFTKGSGYVIINAKDEVMPSIIGTMASMLTKSREFDDGTLVMGLARDTERNTTKVSLRIAGRENGVDLTDVMRRVVDTAGGEAGGHMNAAGAVISTDKEKEFIEAAKSVFEKRDF